MANLADQPGQQPVLWQRRFQDMEEIATLLSRRSLRQRQISLTQLGRGPIEVDLLFLQFHQVQVLFTSSTGPVRCLGEKTQGYFGFSMVLQSHGQGITAHGTEVREHTLFGLDPNRGIDMVIPHHLDFCNVNISKTLFDECLQIMDRGDAVRRYLKVADPATESVTATAHRFGFWSPGHFARDYQRLFGERPSATLLKASDRQQP
jgi:AraC-like DNA-binding protein